MTGRATYRPVAVEASPPALELVDPEPAEARAAIRTLVDGALGVDVSEGLIGAVSEVVTNASRYGRPPVRLRGWVRGREAVVTVSDRGHGPDGPDPGARPVERAPGEGGYGLYLARQMCREIAMGVHDDGFTVRLVAGA